MPASNAKPARSAKIRTMLTDLPPEPPSLALVVGLANPQWLHGGVEGRVGPWGGSLTGGTVGLAHTITGTGRFYPFAGPGGFFLEAGVSGIRLAPVSDDTPAGWAPVGFLGAGYQLQFGRVITNFVIGLPPLALPEGPNPSLFVRNAQALPRVAVQVGFQL